jgi:hypothetical protein
MAAAGREPNRTRTKPNRPSTGSSDQTGRYGLAGLVRRYGPAAGLSEVLAVLSADCPRREDWRSTEPCGACFSDLVQGRPT